MRYKNPPVYFMKIITLIRELAQLIFALPGFVVRVIIPFDRRKYVLAKKMYRLGMSAYKKYQDRKE